MILYVFFSFALYSNITVFETIPVAKSDELNAGDQEVAGSTPAGSAKFFRGYWS